MLFIFGKTIAMYYTLHKLNKYYIFDFFFFFTRDHQNIILFLLRTNQIMRMIRISYHNLIVFLFYYIRLKNKISLILQSPMLFFLLNVFV